MAPAALNPELAPLHRLLRRIGTRRRLVRWSIGALGILGGILFAALGLFLVDWLLDLTPLQRGAVLLAGIVLLAWAFRRYIAPWFGGRESELDLALLLEKHCAIDSDLVAALQFERPEASAWGSVELEDVIIRRVAELARSLPLVEDVPRSPLRKRFLAVLAALFLVCGWIWLAPDYFSTFLRRMTLGNVRYPTATKVTGLLVNRQPLRWDQPGQTARCRPAHGVEVIVSAAGRIPAQGEAVFETPGGRRQVLPLTPVDQENHREIFSVLNSVLKDPAKSVFMATMPDLNVACRLRLALGDAQSEWIDLAPVQPPNAAIWFAYHDGTAGSELAVRAGLSQITVRQGCRVILGLQADHALTKAVAKTGQWEFPLSRGLPAQLEPILAGKNLLSGTNRDAPGSVPEPAPGPQQSSDKSLEFWWLDPAGTPLEHVESPLRITLEVQDRQGLPAVSPLEAYVAVRPDYPPQLQARTLARYVLPTAKPTLLVNARDDERLKRITVTARVVHPTGEDGPTQQWTLWDASAEAVKTLSEKWRIDLTPLQAAKGDRIELVVSAEDMRTDAQPGQQTESDPILLEVTDLAGILAVMADADRESAEQLQEMIDRQLDVGGEGER